jgi:hypothetical protein
MISILSELELCSIDRMTRQELIEAVRARAGDDLPVNLLEQLEEPPTDRLQLLLLLAGRLIRVSRLLRKEAAATSSPRSQREVVRG